MSQVTPEIVKAFAPTGKLRAAINQGNSVLVQKQADGGEPKGITIMLAKELGKRLGVPVELVLFNAAGEVFAALKERQVGRRLPRRRAGARRRDRLHRALCDHRGRLHGGEGFALKTPADVDKNGIRIAVGKGSAYDLYLTRTIKNAEIVRASTGGGRASIDLFLNDKLEVAAGVRQPIAEYAKTNPNVRVMEQRFMAIEQAMGMPKGRGAAAQLSARASSRR